MKNKYWGPKREDRTKKTEQYYINKRWNRLLEYRQYAKTVDSNLTQMADEITKEILPAYQLLREKSAVNDDRIIIQIYAYSDIRPITKGEYIGVGNNVEFISSEWDESNRTIDAVKKYIPDGTSLIGKDNETLSDLRAYFGYMELKRRLLNDSLFNSYAERGEVLFPDEYSSAEEFNEKIKNSRIIILTKGMRIDPVKPDIAGYKTREDDYYELDEVRRINVIVSRVEYLDGRFILSPCCRE